MSEINKSVIQAIDTVVLARLKDLGVDRTISTKITKVIDIATGKYFVNYDNNDNIEAIVAEPEKNIYNVGDDVLIKVIQSDPNKGIYIEGFNIVENIEKKQGKKIIKLNEDWIEVSDEFDLNSGDYIFHVDIVKNEYTGYSNYGINFLQKNYGGDKLIYTFDCSDFTGNPFRYPLNIPISQDILVHVDENYFSLYPQIFGLSNNNQQLQNMRFEPVKVIDFSEVEYWGNIELNEIENNNYLKAQIFNKDIDITKNCTNYNWYYFTDENALDWTLINDTRAKTSLLDLSLLGENKNTYKGIRLTVNYGQREIEVIFKSDLLNPYCNYKCFIYNQDHTINDTKVYSLHIPDPEDKIDAISWEKIRDSNDDPTQIANYYVNENGKLFYTIKQNEFNRNSRDIFKATYNKIEDGSIITVNEYFEIFFIEEQEINIFKDMIIIARPPQGEFYYIITDNHTTSAVIYQFDPTGQNCINIVEDDNITLVLAAGIQKAFSIKMGSNTLYCVAYTSGDLEVFGYVRYNFDSKTNLYYNVSQPDQAAQSTKPSAGYVSTREGEEGSYTYTNLRYVYITNLSYNIDADNILATNISSSELSAMNVVSSNLKFINNTQADIYYNGTNFQFSEQFIADLKTALGIT